MTNNKHTQLVDFSNPNADKITSASTKQMTNNKQQTMTPKDKAKELVDKFTVIGLQQRNEGIQCALIAVAEIINVTAGLKGWIDGFQYWEAVKQEIENYDKQ
jgi:hypothetical protein